MSVVPGKVVVQVCVGKDGLVHDWKVIQEKPEGLGFAVAVEKVIPLWQFTPALQGGEPVSVWIAIPFHFKPE